MEIGARGGSAFVTCLEVPSVVHEERVSWAESLFLSFYSSSLQLQLRVIPLRVRRRLLLLLSSVSCRVEDLVAILLGCSICSPSTSSSGALSSWLRTALRGCGRGRPCYMLHATGNGNGNRVQPRGRSRVGFWMAVHISLLRSRLLTFGFRLDIVLSLLSFLASLFDPMEDGVTSIIFYMALSEYDQVFEEERRVNRMRESLYLFESVINSRWFLRTLPKIPLGRYFPEYVRGNDLQKAAKYILWKFMQENRAKLKVYP